MLSFKDHKLSVNQLLQFIPEALLSQLSITTKVDHYSKVLHGKKMFYLLMYGILENDRLSQRTLEDTFNDTVFKFLFNLDENEKIRRSSISERLAKINPDFFQEIYHCIYEQFSAIHTPKEIEKYQLIRVDSTIISEAAGKLLQGLGNCGKKAVKYSVSFDGLLPNSFKVFTQPKYASEDIALPEVVLKHVKKQKHHQNIYVLDRGLQSTRTMSEFNNQAIKFVCRAKENRKYQLIEQITPSGIKLDSGTLVKDLKVNLYTGVPIKNKKGNIHYKQQLVEQALRLVVIRTGKDKEFHFITNDFSLSANQIAQIYRRR